MTSVSVIVLVYVPAAVPGGIVSENVTVSVTSPVPVPPLALKYVTAVGALVAAGTVIG